MSFVHPKNQKSDSVHPARAQLSLLFALGLMLASMSTSKPTSAQGTYTCPGNPPPQLIINGIAIVAPGQTSRLRQTPSLSASVLARLPERTQVMVTDGPTCADGYTWWQVQQPQLPDSGDQPAGWVAEGHGSDYYMLPFSAPVTTSTNTFTLPTGASSMIVAVDGISFTYNGFAGPTVQEQHSLDYWGAFGGWPGYVESYQFTFGTNQSVPAWLTVVKNGVEFFGKPTMADLAKRFKAKVTPLVDQPINYYLHTGFEAFQVLHAQESYPTLQNLWGLRFIAQYAQTTGFTLDGKDMTYIFFGVTNDDAAYVWANFGVSTGLLADNPLPSNYAPPDNPTAPDPAWQAYVAQTVAKLQKGTAQDFFVTASSSGKATIADLDQMVSSVAIGS